MKKKIVIIILASLFSCQKRQIVSTKEDDNKGCEEKVLDFLYPAHLEELINSNYICDTTIPFLENDKRKFIKQLSVYFSDKNFMLLVYDRKTRLLWDKKEDIIFAFKASEIDNFYFNKKDYKEIYPLKIYVLNKKLIPIYNIGGEQNSVFIDDAKKGRLIEYNIELKNKTVLKKLEDLEYVDILEIVDELKKKEFLKKDDVSSSLLEYFYYDTPVWTEL
jgi:hypothetical protein